ncbi:hypothetical protein A2U01_0092123, partial [Trifolium medium]|nr:hypothetical protein [Trifolium medium]
DPLASLRLASSWRHQVRKFQGSWREVARNNKHISPGDGTCRLATSRPDFGAQPSNLALSTPKIHSNQLIDP